MDPDRLPEEQERGITIELGFAPVDLPGGRAAAFVDVPGHERFVRTMVAGATGIDVALLVVAADEGPMPQTREHLAILDLLGVPGGVVALSKSDLVEEGWVALVAEEVRQMLAGTVLADAAIVPVSSVTEDGLDRLREELARAIGRVPERKAQEVARLPIDRVFTVAGHGTVVTGTLVAGVVHDGERLWLEPEHREIRVRALEVHGVRRQEARAGERTAVNLTGVERADIRRGNVLAAPGAVSVTRAVACDLALLPGATLENQATIHVHVGTAETIGRVVLLEGDVLEGNEPSSRVPRAARLTFRDPLAVSFGDRMILRGGTPLTTLGGARVLDPAGQAYRRHRPESLRALEEIRRGDPTTRLRQVLRTSGELVWDAPRAALQSGLTVEAAAAALEALLHSGEALPGPGGGVVLKERWQHLKGRVHDLLADYHEAHPLRTGMAREEVRRRVAPELDGRRFAFAIATFSEEGWLRSTRELLALREFSPEHSPAAREVLDRAVGAFHAAGLSGMQEDGWTAVKGGTPDQGGGKAGAVPEALSEPERDEILGLLLRTGRLVRVGELILHPEAIERARKVLEDMLREEGSVTAGAYRDRLGVSRRIAVPLLDFFDQSHVTRRIGDRHEPWVTR